MNDGAFDLAHRALFALFRSGKAAYNVSFVKFEMPGEN